MVLLFRPLYLALCSAMLALGAIGSSTAAWGQEMVVIVNKSNPNTIGRTYLQQLYTGTVRSWPDGTAVVLFDLPDGQPLREQFYTTQLARSAANVRSIWTQNIFTGRGFPPKVVATEAEMKQLVSSSPLAIGYIRASELDSTVRALTLSAAER
jgi:ABC-type phosphate transport system substrate-binding protein